MRESQTELNCSSDAVDTPIQAVSVGFLVVDREHFSVLRRNGEVHRLGESIKSAPAVFQFRDQALNALIDQTIKHPDLRAEVMDVSLDQRQKVLWPDDWLAAREEFQAQAQQRQLETMDMLAESREPMGQEKGAGHAASAVDVEFGC